MKNLWKLVVLLTLTLMLAGCGKTINLNKYISVEVTGYNGYGHAEVTFDEEAFEEDYGTLEYKESGYRLWYGNADEYILDYCVAYELSEADGLSNGDTITLVWSCKDTDVEAALGSKLKYSDISVKVKRLEVVETFDAFENIEVSFEGVAPNGNAKIINNAPESSNLSKIKYSIDKASGLKEGDVITITVANTTDIMLELFEALPEKITREYTVTGIPSYVNELNQIDVATIEKMQKQADEYLKAHLESYYSHPDDVKGIKNFGTYLISKKEGSNNGINNGVFFAYEITTRDRSFKDENATFNYYQYVAFTEITKSPDGTINVDLNDYRVATHRFEYKYRYYGYYDSADMIGDIKSIDFGRYNFDSLKE